MKDETVLNVEEIVLNVEELEERIAPSATSASHNGIVNGSTPEVPVGAHPQPNPPH